MRWARCPVCGDVLPEDAVACPCGEDLSDVLLPLERGDPVSRGHARGPGRAPPARPPRRPSGDVRPSTRRERGVAAALGAVLVAVLAAGAVTEPPSAVVDGRRARITDVPTDIATALRRPGRPARPPGPPAVVPPGWTWKPVGPLLARTGHVAAWTGTEVVLWAGERPGRHPDGAAYHPQSDRWRRIARAPIENRFAAGSAWTGREVIVWGGVNGGGTLADGAAYDPVADRWRLLPRSPLSNRVPLAVAWTGSELIVAGAKGYGRTHGLADAAAYDPAADAWRALPPLPVEINEGMAVWTGAELVVYGGHLDRNRRPVGGDDRARGAALDPATGTWRALAGAPLSGQGIAFAWDGRQVVAWDYALDSAAYDPAADRWSDLPDLPLKRGDCLPAGVAAGRVVFAQHCGQAAVFEPDRRAWAPVPTPTGASDAPVFTGEALVHWLGPTGRPHDGTWLRPVT